MGAPRAYFFIPTSFLYSSDLSCFWAILGGFALSCPLCEQDKQLLFEIRQGREKDPGVISLRRSLPVVLCSLCFSPPREPTTCISMNVSTRLCVHVSHSVVSDCCDPMDCSLPGSSVHGILQARVLEWVAISFSKTLYLVLIKKKEINLPFTSVHSQGWLPNPEIVFWIQVFFFFKELFAYLSSHFSCFFFFFFNLALLYKKPKFYWTWLKQDFKAHSLLNILLHYQSECLTRNTV